MTVNRRAADALYRISFGAFAYAAYAELNPNTPLIPNWHIDCICHYLQEMEDLLKPEGEPKTVSSNISNRLVINLPPRSLKSFLVSVAWVAWCLGRNPSLQVVCASYAEELAHKFSRDCRALMETAFYKRVFPQTRINPKKSTEAEFETTKRGSRIATSVGGTLTGRGANILIVDDPTKANDANSKLALEATNEWFRNTALSRFNHPSERLVVVTQQRLHSDDLSGVLIERGWSSLVIPAIANEVQDYAIGKAQTYHRATGELLQPNRDNAETLDDIKREVGSRIFSAQYQQNPTPPDGNMIKASWLPRYPSIPPRDKFRTVVLSCDPSGKAGSKNDYTAITIVGVDAKELYLLHVSRGHWTILEMQHQIMALAAQWTVTHVIVEDTASGMGLIQLLREQTSLPAFGIHPKDDKETRLSRHQGRFEAGRILLPMEAPWLADFENELLAFPNGRNDDQVDALLLFLDWFSKNEYHLTPMTFPAPIILRLKRDFFGDPS
jgi:predicted phage terminase large subunit-like protein